MTNESLKKSVRRSGVIIMAFILLVMNGVVCWAADVSYPNRPINMIVGFAPGGASDLGAKVVSERMGEFLGQPMVAVYKPGAGGTLAGSFVAKAKPDGYTVLVLNNTMALPPEVKPLDYALDDFALIGEFSKGPFYVAVKADARWKAFADLVAEAKKNPFKLTFGSGGKNTGPEFMGWLLDRNHGVQLTHVPFKSCGEAMTNLLGGHIDVYICTAQAALADRSLVNVLAVAEPKRLEGIEEIPTLTELGYPILYSHSTTFAVPKETPKEVVTKLVSAQRQCMEKYRKEIQAALKNVNLWPSYEEPEMTHKTFSNNNHMVAEIVKKVKRPTN